MTRNLSTPERLVRFVIGIVLLGLYGALPGPWRLLALLGLMPLGTAWVTKPSKLRGQLRRTASATGTGLPPLQRRRALRYGA